MATAPMQGMLSMWFDHYKGSVYPLVLEAPPYYQRMRTKVSSLLETCCAYIVRDSKLTQAALDSVPNILYTNLMEAALLGNHDRSIHLLMSKWMLKSLVLTKLVPSVFCSILPLYEPEYQSDLVRQGLRYTTSLAHTFLECLRQNSPTKIRYLDLTGFPTAEVILYYLTSHCMLVHNEARRDNMVTLYNQAVNIAEEFSGEIQGNHDAMDIDMQNYLPNDITIAIKLDAFVTSESCHSELCKALTVSSFPSSRFQIIVEKLSVTCLGGDRVNLLLRQIKPKELKGLQLKYNSIRNMDFIRMAPVLQSLINLTALDLSCNHISLFNNEPMSVIMSQAFSTLSNLERLDLSNCRLKNNLRSVLKGISNPLKQFRLAACGLTPSDLAALAACTFLSHTEELDLSENNLNISDVPMMKILGKISKTIKIFELQDCCVEDETIDKLLSCFDVEFNNLLYLNVAENSWASSVTSSLVRTLSRLNKLQVLRLSYPRDCYPSDALADLVDAEEPKQHFKASILDILRANTSWDHRTDYIKLIYIDLEKT